MKTVRLSKDDEAQIKALESSDGNKLSAALRSLRKGARATTGADGEIYSDQIYTGEWLASGVNVRYSRRGNSIYRHVTGPDGELFSHRRI